MPKKNKPPFIGIRLEGGMIQSVFSNHPDMIGAGVVIIDYDTDNASPEDLVEVDQDDGSCTDAYVCISEISQSELSADKFNPPLEEIRDA